MGPLSFPLCVDCGKCPPGKDVGRICLEATRPGVLEALEAFTRLKDMATGPEKPDPSEGR